jgi:hypothetical protein
MDDKELQTLSLSHYESESQTLTSAAEANLWNIKNRQNHNPEEQTNDGRHQSDLRKKQQTHGLNRIKCPATESDDGFFTENLEGIKEVLWKGFLQ